MKWGRAQLNGPAGKVIAGASIILLSDQVSKFFASQAEVVTLNSGVSLGLFSNFPVWTWGVVIILLCVLIGRIFWKTGQRFPFWGGVFIGGIASNLIDRVFFDGVRDFLPLPMLNLRNNLADYAIVGSVLFLAWVEMKAGKTEYR
jgi:lipoprotein signal peptidase